MVRSGLVQLMDRLCSLSSQTESGSNEKQTKKQKVATMAWAAFQVLANRCVEWEKEEGRNTASCTSVVCLRTVQVHKTWFKHVCKIRHSFADFSSVWVP